MALRRGFSTWCERSSLGYRRDLGLPADGRLNPKTLAAHLGVLVWTPSEVVGLDKQALRQLIEVDPESWSAVTLISGKIKLIIHNEAHSPERQASNLAHELAHLILEHRPTQIFVTADGQMMMREYDKSLEEEAGCLSGVLLVPREALLARLRAGMSDREVAAHFGVSAELLRMRKNLTGVAKQLGPKPRRAS